MPKKYLVIDTDAGVDDAVALAMALKMSADHGFELKLISTCFGNVDVQQVTTNVCKTIEECDASCGVCVGASGPLREGVRLDATYFHGSDGLGDHSLLFGDDGTGARSRIMEEGLLTATDRFLELCRAVIASSVSTELVLVTLGPLTNLATFLEADRLLCLSAISKLYIMGGCGNGRGNCSRTAEFNICADPEASSRVFEEKLWRGITVVPWEVCIGHPIPWENFDALVQSPSLTKLGRFISNICQLPYVKNREDATGKDANTMSSKRATGGAVICDALCMAVALDEALVAEQVLVHVAVELNGTFTRGQTVVDFGHSYDTEIRERKVRWITEVHTDLFVRIFQRLFE